MTHYPSGALSRPSKGAKGQRKGIWINRNDIKQYKYDLFTILNISHTLDVHSRG